MKQDISSQRILIAKITQLGDLVISLPMAGIIKQRYPSATVLMLTSAKTADVARRCLDVDDVHAMPDGFEKLPALLKSLNIDVLIQASEWKELAWAAKAAKIPMRVGSLYRSHNWWLCTDRVAISRGHRQLNKRLLDLEYLRPFGIASTDLKQLPELYRFSKKNGQRLAEKLGLNYAKHRIILHPTLTTAKAHQWPLSHYSALIQSFGKDRFQWIITGTEADRSYLQPLLDSEYPQADVVDAVGQLTLDELMTFMMECDGLVAGSTGPLHLAAALGLHTVGLLQSKPAVNRRWAPVGRSASILYSSSPCVGDKRPEPCPCILAITPDSVKACILNWFEASDIADSRLNEGHGISQLDVR